MTRSPNYGKRRPRHARQRDIYLVDIERSEAGVIATVAGPRQPPVSFWSENDSDAIGMIQMLKAGMFSLPINPLP